MSDHIPDATKMIQDTPRTDAVYFKPDATMYDLAGEMKVIERELNSANERIKRLEEEFNKLGSDAAELLNSNGELERRIKRLKEAGDAILDANNDDEQYEAMKQWYKAKEAKL
jgi:predicted  nucleic acid-binding Zn-ribbon protein